MAGRKPINEELKKGIVARLYLDKETSEELEELIEHNFTTKSNYLRMLIKQQYRKTFNNK